MRLVILESSRFDTATFDYKIDTLIFYLLYFVNLFKKLVGFTIYISY